MMKSILNKASTTQLNELMTIETRYDTLSISSFWSKYLLKEMENMVENEEEI